MKKNSYHQHEGLSGKLREARGRGGGRIERHDPNCKTGLSRGFLKKKKKKQKIISGVTQTSLALVMSMTNK